MRLKGFKHKPGVAFTRNGEAGSAMPGLQGHARHGKAGVALQGPARRGVARRGKARQGRCGGARYGMADPGPVG